MVIVIAGFVVDYHVALYLHESAVRGCEEPNLTTHDMLASTQRGRCPDAVTRGGGNTYTRTHTQDWMHECWVCHPQWQGHEALSQKGQKRRVNLPSSGKKRAHLVCNSHRDICVLEDGEDPEKGRRGSNRRPQRLLHGDGVPRLLLRVVFGRRRGSFFSVGVVLHPT